MPLVGTCDDHKRNCAIVLLVARRRALTHIETCGVSSSRRGEGGAQSSHEFARERAQLFFIVPIRVVERRNQRSTFVGSRVARK